MSGSIMRRITTAGAALALGGIATLAVQSPALAADFSAGYTCTAPVLGTQTATITGALTASPDATAGSPVDFALDITEISLRAPVAINSWTMTVNLDVTGAETARFQAVGSGTKVPANKPITGKLTGSWTPTVTGTDEISGADVVVKANVVLLGDITIACTPAETRPVAETVTVA